MVQNNRAEGNRGEDIACAHLAANGCRIIERNFRSRRGEIDIIADDAGTVVFAEVKYRKGTGSGQPYEAVTKAKQRTICRTADFYCMKNALSENRAYRFDVLSILGDTVTWYKNAFEYIQ